MNRTDIVIILLGLLFMTTVIIVGEAQQEQVVEENKITYNNDDHMFEYFMKGVIIMDTFNPIRKASYYKCEMGKTYPYSLS